jgi:endogenous inhibitor of DNA gyrase (YacG/DUF329 family)
MREAKCPQCGEWHRVIDEAPGFIYHLWAWADNHGAACPSCGMVVLFESECDFREVAK